MTMLCDWCCKTKREVKTLPDGRKWTPTVCGKGLEMKRYHEQCEEFSPYEYLKHDVDDIIRFHGLDGNVKEKFLALKNLYELYLTRDELVALELTAHNYDRKGGLNEKLNKDALESAHEKLLKAHDIK